jgi:hypothetical protein
MKKKRNKVFKHSSACSSSRKHLLPHPKNIPLPIVIPPISPQSPSPIIRGWYNKPVVAAVPKVPHHEFKKKNPRT